MEKNNNFYYKGNLSTGPFHSAPPNNNDNNIYNSNNTYSSGTTITNIDYYMLSNLIIFKAIQKYNQDYKSNIVPYSYIGFYFKEVSKYTTLHSPYLTLYLSTFNRKRNNLADSISIFSKTFSDFIELKSVKKASFFTGLQPGEYVDANKKFLTKEITSSDQNNLELNNALKQVLIISEKIDSTSAEKKLKMLYIDYLSTNQEKSTAKTITPIENNIRLTSKKTVIAPPKQIKENKISSIKLRKLKIGRTYPTSLTHSRIDSAHFAFKFTEGHDCYKIVEKYRFTHVKYTTGFETKRKELFEEKKSDFDLF